MIKIGLTGFSDHEELYGKMKSTERLGAYSAYFSFVEIDSSFYAVLPVKNYARWVQQTPDDFRFVVKAYQGMTGHLRGKKQYFESDREMYEAFHKSIAPLREAGKLSMVLFQYPPWFDCSKESAEHLRETKERMEDVPVAVEFRNASWYSGELRERTPAFLQELGWIHTVVDEPQIGTASVPLVPVTANPRMTYVRLHGRNARGWSQGANPDWRKERYLYRYSSEELEEWRDRLLALEPTCKELYVAFNNNSGGDAGPNAQKLQALLGIDGGLAPRQLDLFS